MLVMVACVALNIWCFKVSAILGIIGLNVTKHVAIAQLCQAIGVNRRTKTSPTERIDAETPILSMSTPTILPSVNSI